VENVAVVDEGWATSRYCRRSALGFTEPSTNADIYRMPLQMVTWKCGGKVVELSHFWDHNATVCGLRGKEFFWPAPKDALHNFYMAVYDKISSLLINHIRYGLVARICRSHLAELVHYCSADKARVSVPSSTLGMRACTNVLNRFDSRCRKYLFAPYFRELFLLPTAWRKSPALFKHTGHRKAASHSICISRPTAFFYW